MTLTSYLAQAKERLEKANPWIMSGDIRADLKLLLLIVERQREALAFYADIKSWEGDDGEQTAIKDSDCYRNTNMNDDLFGGLRALQAISDIEELLSEE